MADWHNFGNWPGMPSSVIRKYEYRPELNILTITFVSGAVYDYLDVPASVYNQMRSVLSKGAFFNQHIRDKFECVRAGLGREW